MKFFMLFFVPFLLFAKVHYVKVEPFETVTLKSAVSALVVDVDLEAEGSVVDKKCVISLDDRLDKINLSVSQKNILILHETLGRQEAYFKRINQLQTTSMTQKDSAFYGYASAKTQYLDMEYKVAQLKDSIEKKSIILHQRYLYEILVHQGDFVSPGTPLAKIADTNRAKLVLYLEPSEVQGVEKKVVYLDDKKTHYKVDKVWTVADEKFISSYRAEIYIASPKVAFSKLLKVELK